MPPVTLPAGEMFRCEHGGGNGPPCSLLKVRCLERQGKTWERKGATATKRWVASGATFTFCASGDCEQGKAVAAELGGLPAAAGKKRRNFGSVVALMPRAKPSPAAAAPGIGLTAADVAATVVRVRDAMRQPTRVATPRRPVLVGAPEETRVDASEVASHAPAGESPAPDPASHAPVNPEPPAAPALEDVMPCGSCGKTGHNSRACTEKKSAAPAKKAIPALPPPPKGATTARPPAVRVVARAASVEDLLARREALTAELASVEEQLRGRLAEEEARLVKLREAVAAAAKRAEAVAA